MYPREHYQDFFAVQVVNIEQNTVLSAGAFIVADGAMRTPPQKKHPAILIR